MCGTILQYIYSYGHAGTCQQIYQTKGVMLASYIRTYPPMVYLAHDSSHNWVGRGEGGWFGVFFFFFLVSVFPSVRTCVGVYSTVNKRVIYPDYKGLWGT